MVLLCAKGGGFMRRMLEALWYGNIDPQQICKRNNPKIMDLLSLLSRNRTELRDTLTDAQKEILQKWDDNEQEMTDIVEKEIFINGFRLGARFVLEALCDDNPLDEESVNN